VIVGCYSMDLYCKNDKSCQRLTVAHTIGFAQTTGENRTQCLSAAKKLGWKITKGDAICPYCLKADNG
jgi:hypothetical protein